MSLPLELLPALCDLSMAAGREILKVYAQDFGVARKADASPLTEADMASHRHILAGLQQLTPDWPVLSEESKEVPESVRRTWSRYWLVDPLDGTKEFIKRNGEFTVNIALIDDGKPVMGVIHAPVFELTAWGAVGHGAFRQQSNGPIESISANAERGDCIRISASRSHPDPRLQGLLEQLAPTETVNAGSSLKFLQVASGEADLYPRFGPTSEWDTGAGQAIVEAAGAWVLSLGNEPLRYNQRASLLNDDFMVVAPWLRARLMESLAASRALV